MHRSALLLFLLASAADAAAHPQGGRISRIEFTPAGTEDGGGVFISLIGTGPCTYSLDYGDGKSDTRTADLPDRVRHVYPADGEYLVVATPQAPCEGVARAKLDVRAIDRGIWSLSAEPGPDTQNAEMLVTIAGRGECALAIDYGDGTIDKDTVVLPATRSHKYMKTGIYELKVTAEPPCRGDAALRIEVKRHAAR